MQKIRKYRSEGKTVCTFSSDRRQTGIPRADALYERFCDAAERHAREVVFPNEARRYEEDEDPRKRFYHRPILCDCRIRLAQSSEDAVTVEGEYSVDGRPISRFTHVWDRRAELIRPRGFHPSVKALEKAKKKAEKR